VLHIRGHPISCGEGSFDVLSSDGGLLTYGSAVHTSVRVLCIIGHLIPCGEGFFDMLYSDVGSLTCGFVIQRSVKVLHVRELHDELHCRLLSLHCLTPYLVVMVEIPF
jgi:hypothetical protein